MTRIRRPRGRRRGHPVVHRVGARRPSARIPMLATGRNGRFAGGPQIAIGATTVMATNVVCSRSSKIALTRSGPVSRTALSAGRRTPEWRALTPVVRRLSRPATWQPVTDLPTRCRAVASCPPADNTRQIARAPTSRAAPPNARAVLSSAALDGSPDDVRAEGRACGEAQHSAGCSGSPPSGSGDWSHLTTDRPNRSAWRGS